MNSYNNKRNMSYKGTRKRAMPAPKLMAIENEYHRTKDALVHEIKRLRGEVGTLAKRYNNAKREIEDLVRRVRSQPPPPVPRRDEETERKIKKRHERWVEHLQRETEVEKIAEKEEEIEEKKDDDIVMPTAMDEPPEETSNPLSPEQPPMDQEPQSEVESITVSQAQSPDPTPPASSTDEDAEMEDEVKTIKQRVTRMSIYVEDGWKAKMLEVDSEERRKVYLGRAKRWKESCELLAIAEPERGIEGDVKEVAERIEDIVALWYEARRRGKFRGWGNPSVIDGMLYAKYEVGWRFKLITNGMEFWEF